MGQVQKCRVCQLAQSQDLGQIQLLALDITTETQLSSDTMECVLFLSLHLPGEISLRERGEIKAVWSSFTPCDTDAGVGGRAGTAAPGEDTSTQNPHGHPEGALKCSSAVQSLDQSQQAASEVMLFRT